jgi:hypothetical protein
VSDTLIVLEKGVSLDRLIEHWPIAQVLPPRIAVVRLSPEAIRMRGGESPEVRVLEHPEEAAAIDPPLGDGERLFVDAWFHSRQPKARRPGDGLPWDAPGFEPP